MLRRLAFALGLLAALSPALLHAQTPGMHHRAPSPGFADAHRVQKLRSAFPAIDALMADFARREQVPGIAYGIVVDGALVHVGTHGLRDVEAGASVDTNTVFRIASMTKSFTALAILQLRDAGLLALDDPAERYVPELAGLEYPTSDAPKITLRHLLTHAAGFPEDNPWGDQQLALTDDEMGALLRGGIPFSTAPGTAYEYSNYGFAILGRIVANVSGMPYARYVEENVFVPLGMTAATLEADDVPADRLARGYRLQDGAWLGETPLPDGAFGPMGGMLMPVTDLGRWVAFLLDAWPARDGEERAPLRRASAREMQQVQHYNGAVVTKDADTGEVTLSAGGYGYGLGVRQTCDARAVVAHSGGLPGYGSLMRWLPDYGVGIVALGNKTYTRWGSVVDEAFEKLRETGGLVPRAATPAPILLERQAEVSRLITDWDDALADRLAAMNLFLDEPRERRRAALEKLRDEAGGDCRIEGVLHAENALRGAWRMRCATGDLRVTITLAPTMPATVQHLDVKPMGRDETLEPPSACR